jgi:hypothetical protein
MQEIRMIALPFDTNKLIEICRKNDVAMIGVLRRYGSICLRHILDAIAKIENGSPASAD